MKRIVIIGANSFLAQNFYTYLTNVHQSIEIYLYDIQEFFSLNKSIYYQQIDFFSIPSIEKINLSLLVKLEPQMALKNIRHLLN